MWVSCSENKRCQNWLQRWVETSAICERMSRTTTTVSPSYWVAYWLRARMMRECKLSVKNGDDVGERVWISYNVAWTCGTYIQTDRQTDSDGGRQNTELRVTSARQENNERLLSVTVSICQRDTQRNRPVQCLWRYKSYGETKLSEWKLRSRRRAENVCQFCRTFVENKYDALLCELPVLVIIIIYYYWQHGTRHSVHLRHATLKSAQCRYRPA